MLAGELAGVERVPCDLSLAHAHFHAPSDELACKHERSFAKHRTVTALAHARSLKERRGEHEQVLVQERPLSVYDQLIA